MSEAEGEVVAIHAGTTGLAGRFIVSAGTNHFVTDARPNAGGPGEAVQAGQLLLAALASCGLGLIQSQARERGEPLAGAKVEAAFQRDPEDKTRYRWITLRFILQGVQQAAADALLAHFTGTCPIYNTLARGGVVRAEAVAA